MNKSYHLGKGNLGLTFGNYLKVPTCFHSSVLKKTNVLTAMLIAFCFAVSGTAFGQGVFTSAATGDWNNAGSWTLSSGTDGDGIPDADDNVTIASANVITVSAATTVECNNLTVAGGSATSLTMAGANSIVNIFGSLSATVVPSAGNYIDCTADATAKAVFKRTTSGDLITGTWGTFGEKARVEVDLGAGVTGTVTVPVKFRELIIKSGTFSTTGEIRPDEGTPNTGKVTVENGATLITTSIFRRTGTLNLPFASLTINGNGKIVFNGITANSLPVVASGFPVYTFSSGAIIEYQGGAQTIADINYPNLIINATGAKTFNTTTNAASRTVAGNVTVSANRLGITASTTYPVTVNGNISITGTTSNLLMNGGDLICLGNLTLSATGGTVTAPTLWFASTAARVMGGTTATGTGIFTVGAGACVRNIFSSLSAGPTTPVTTQFPYWQTLDLQTGSTWQYAIPANASGTRYQDVEDSYNGNAILYKTLVLSYLNSATTGSNVITTIKNPSIATAFSVDISAAAAAVAVSQNIMFANTSSLTIPSMTTSQLTAAITTNQNITFGAQPVIVSGNVSITNPTATQLGTSTVVTLNAGSLSIGGTLTLGSTPASTTLNNPYILLNNAASALSVTGATTLRSSEQTNGNIKFTNSAQTVTFNGPCSTANGNATAEIFNFNGFSPTINFNNNYSDTAVGVTFSVTGTEVPVINFNNGTSIAPLTTSGAVLRGAVTVSGYRQATGNVTINNDLTLDSGTLATGANTLTLKGATSGSGLIDTGVSGTLVYNGAVAQTVSNLTASTANNLTINNAAGVTVGADATVTTDLTITSGSLTVVSGKNLTVNNNVINNGTLVLENNANLVQTKNGISTNSGTGTAIVKRNSNPLSRLDYTLWSSPVANQNLLAFSPATTTTRFYNYNTTFTDLVAIPNITNGAFSAIDPSVNPFAVGSGYLIRMPNTAVTFPETETFNGQFTGVPNNGDVPVALVDGGAGLRYNLVGNPYPSAITIATFVTDNAANIETTLYFWRKTNGTGSAYCTYNTAGSPMFTTNGNAQSVDPSGVIQIGQGFFVEAKSGATSLTFKNGQRVANNANQFFKTKQLATPSRIWLNATTTKGGFSQMAVNYADGATQGVDDYDSKYINDSAFALTSNINNEEYTIQGRPAFDASDVVPLNFKTDIAGDYTIAIDHVDGLFLGNQDIYLVDSKTGAETNLKTSSYTFTAAAAVDNARFSLKYQKTLSIEGQEISDNSVIVYKNSGVIYVNSGAKMMNNIKVFDIQGRVVAEQKNLKANTTSIQNLRASNQVLIVKITTEDNQVISKKVEN